MPPRHDVIQYRHVGKQLNPLKSPPNTQPGAKMYRHLGDVLALKRHLSFLGLIKSGKAIHQTGFAGTVGADYGKDLIFEDLKGDIVKNFYPAKG